jgi:hypothetical protein
MTQADNYIKQYPDANDLMNAINSEIECIQDYENETTFYIFDDNSKIIICNEDITVVNY